MEYKETTLEEPSRLDSTDSTIESPTEFNSRDFFKEHLVRTDSGGYEIQGDDLSPVEMALLETEKRRRGTQAVASREKVRADRFETELTHVKTELPQMDPSRLAPQVDPALKYSDPDEYIRLSMEAAKHNPYEEVFNTASQKAADEVGQRTVETEIAEFNADNPKQQITLEMLELDLPPRLVQEFQTGKMDPQDFLGQAADILYRPTEVHNQAVPGQPDLGNVGGQTTPSDDGSNEKLAENYASAIF
jgi:hypothetical protein